MVHMLLHKYLTESVAHLAEKVAITCGDERITYRQLQVLADKVAAALQARGVRRGDRVALFMDNGIEMVATIFGVLEIGAVFMPVNPLTKREKFRFLLQDSRACALVAHAALAASWRPAIDSLATLHTCIVTGQLADATSADDRQIPFPRQTDDTGNMLRAPSCAETIDQDLAAIIYTSGSTGEPKGVMLTHLNMDSALRSVMTYLCPRQDDVIMCVLPLAFGYGLYHALMSVATGATLVLEQSFAFPAKALQTMSAEQVTIFPAVPTIFSQLVNMKGLDQYDLSALRILTNAAAALSEEHIRRVRALFPQASFYSMYGMTECKRISYLPPDQLDVRPSSVGRGMPNQELWLVDDAGNRLPNGSTGELVVRGSHIMRGYWERPELTAERLRAGPIPGENVLYTGDIFRTDADGWLYFVSRKDDIIKSRGEKVSPREVENVLYELNGVLEVAVVGTPDTLLGSAIKAFIVADHESGLTERDVLRQCQLKLESFMVPKYVEFVPHLPKTDNGKIKKTGLS